MPDELNAVSDATPSDASQTVTQPPTTTTPSTDDDLGALKRAYERTKEELKEAKAAAKRAAILDQLEQGGIKAEDLPAKLAELKSSEQQEQEMARLRAEWESQANQREKEITQRYEQQVSSLNDYLKKQTRQSRLSDVFMAGGGSTQNELDAKHFQALASEYIEFEDTPIKNEAGVIVGYRSDIKAFKSPAGEQLWVDHEKEMGKVRPGELNDFLKQVKEGKYGVALQNLLPAYNQSSGAGVPSAGGLGGGNVIRTTRSQLAEMMGKMTSAELAEFKKDLSSGKRQISYIDD